VVGIAAFLGGAYKVPLAGVAFVAETTGAPGYIIPGLLAAAIGYLVSGDDSVSDRQRSRRRSDLETRLALSVGDAMSRDWTEVPPTATVQEFASRYVTLARARSLPVAEAGAYVGIVQLDSLSELPADRWREVPVSSIMRTDVVPAAREWPVERAVRTMRTVGLEQLPVVSDGRLVGVIRAADVVRLEDIISSLDAAGEGDADRPTRE
jgi:Mg/Co/Ni transporter MgtE